MPSKNKSPQYVVEGYTITDVDAGCSATLYQIDGIWQVKDFKSNEQVSPWRKTFISKSMVEWYWHSYLPAITKSNILLKIQ